MKGNNRCWLKHPLHRAAMENIRSSASVTSDSSIPKLGVRLKGVSMRSIKSSSTMSYSARYDSCPPSPPAQLHIKTSLTLQIIPTIRSQEVLVLLHGVAVDPGV